MTRSSQVSPVNNWEQSVPSSDDNKDKGPQAETSMFMKQTSVAGPRYIHISFLLLLFQITTNLVA